MGAGVAQSREYVVGMGAAVEECAEIFDRCEYGVRILRDNA
jgi:hypothetical protein